MRSGNGSWWRALAAVAAGAVALAGCNQATYNYKDRVNLSRDGFIQAFTSDRESDLASIKPLPAPLTPRKLLVVAPTPDGFYAQRLAHLKQSNPNVTMEHIHLEGVSEVQYLDYSRNTKNWIVRKNIYPTVEQVISDNAGTFEPSDQFDVLTIAVAANRGQRDQWLHYSKRNGRQTVNMDQSEPTTLGQIESLLDSVKAVAIQ